MSYFNEDHYLVRRKILKLVGGAFHIYDKNEQVVAYSKLKAFKLKEDIRIYTGEDMQQEIFRIHARNIIDFGATYDVIDSATETKLGALRRKGFQSMIKDEWTIMDTNDNEIGLIQEDSMALALIRRFVCNLIPQNYDCSINGQLECRFKQNFNPFVMKIGVNFTNANQVNRYLTMAGAVLLCAIEGKQE